MRPKNAFATLFYSNVILNTIITWLQLLFERGKIYHHIYSYLFTLISSSFSSSSFSFSYSSTTTITTCSFSGSSKRACSNQNNKDLSSLLARVFAFFSLLPFFYFFTAFVYISRVLLFMFKVLIIIDPAS